MSASTYNLLMLLATAASAVGTIAAVIVALYLADRQHRPRVEVNTGLKLLVAHGERFVDAPTFCLVSVVNVGSVPAHVQTLFWKAGWPWKGGFHQMPSNHRLSGQLPKVLQPGDGIDLLFPISEFAEVSAKIREHLNSGPLPSLAWRRLRAGVVLRTGQSYWSRPSIEALAVIQTGQHQGRRMGQP